MGFKENFDPENKRLSELDRGDKGLSTTIVTKAGNIFAGYKIAWFEHQRLLGKADIKGYVYFRLVDLGGGLLDLVTPVGRRARWRFSFAGFSEPRLLTNSTHRQRVFHPCG